MSGLLKAQASTAVTARLVPAGDPVHDEQVMRLRQHIATLEAGIDARDARIAELGDEVKSAYLQGEAAGLAQAQDDVAQRRDRLETAIAAAEAHFADTLAGTERLAALIAREALARLFTQGGDRAQLVLELIRHQMAQLEGMAVLSVAVSSVDFGSKDAQDLAAQIGLPETTSILIRDDLTSGACTIALRLGEIEIGLDQQWGILADLLDSFTATGLPV